MIARLRDQSRPKPPQGREWAVFLDEALRTTLSDIGNWIDSSDQTPEETVEQVLISLWHDYHI